MEVKVTVDHYELRDFPRVSIFWLFSTVEFTNLVAWLVSLKRDKLALEVVVVDTTKLMFHFDLIVYRDLVFLALDPE